MLFPMYMLTVGYEDLMRDHFESYGESVVTHCMLHIASELKGRDIHTSLHP